MSARDDEIRRVLAELEVHVAEAEVSIAVLKALLADDEVQVEENPQATGLHGVLGAVYRVDGGRPAEQAQLVQPPDPPHGPGVRPGQLGDSDPETAEVAPLVDQLAGLHVTCLILPPARRELLTLRWVTSGDMPVSGGPGRQAS